MLQLLLPALLCLPSSHSSQAVASIVPEKRPLEHFEHSSLAAFSANFPLKQLLQADAPNSAYFPGKQSSQTTLPTVPAVPTGQDESHEDAPALLKEPALQG